MKAPFNVISKKGGWVTLGILMKGIYTPLGADMTLGILIWKFVKIKMGVDSGEHGEL